MAVAAGLAHSAAFDEDGVLFVWGWGERGQLGTGNTDSRLTPTRVDGLPAPVVAVAAVTVFPGPVEIHLAVLTGHADVLLGLRRLARLDVARLLELHSMQFLVAWPAGLTPLSAQRLLAVSASD